MSLPYNELPVYFGLANQEVVNTGLNETTGYIPATQVSVNYSTNHSPKRNLGKTVSSSDQFRFGGALQANISVESLVIEGMETGFDFVQTAAQEAYIPIKIGDNDFKKCYATEVSVGIQPYGPVMIKAQFVSLDPATGVQISGDKTPYDNSTISFDSDKVAYGQDCVVTNADLAVGQVQSQISFSRRYARSPVYTLGSVNPSSMLLDGIEEELSITSTGLNNLINLSGDKLGSSLSVNINNVGVGITTPLISLISFGANSRVLDESYDVRGGEVLNANALIKQVKL
mgnify:FL=1